MLPLLFRIEVIFVAIFYCYIHILIDTSLPIPWSDEAYFLIPTLSLAHHLNFDANFAMTDSGFTPCLT